MIIVFNGETLTSTATEDEVLFMDIDDDGRPKSAGRVKVDFEVLTGTVQIAVGKSVTTAKASSHTTSAAPKFSATISNQAYPVNEPQEGGPRNLRIIGAGTVSCTW